MIRFALFLPVILGMAASMLFSHAAPAQTAGTRIIYIDDFAAHNFLLPISDWTPVVAAAVNSFPTNLDAGGDGMGGTIVFGPSPGMLCVACGPYNFLSPAIPGAAQGYGIELNRAVKLVGTSGAPAANSFGASQLTFAAGLGGVRANYTNFPVNGRLGSDGTLIEGLSLIGAGPNNGPKTAHGIFYNSVITVRDVSISGFPGDGLNTDADLSVSKPSSSSLSLIDNVYAAGNGGNGSTTLGGDANQIMFHNFKARSNGGWGIYESSFIGSQYYGGYVEGNLGGGIWANHPSGASGFFGVYIEEGDALNIGGNNSIFGDPLASAALAAGSTARSFSGNGMSANVSASKDGKSVLAIGNGFNDASMFMGWADTQEAGGAWPWRFKNFGNGALGPDRAESGQPVIALLNSRALKANGFPVDAALVPDVAHYGGNYLRSFFLGNANGGVIFHGVANSIPTSTAYPVGSVVENSAAVNVGDPVAWKLVNRSGSLKWVIAGTLQN